MSCNPKCHFTCALDGPGGGRLMVSQGGGKFPLGFVHPMCSECLKEQIEEAKLGVLFNNGRNFIDRWRKLKDKAG